MLNNVTIIAPSRKLVQKSTKSRSYSSLSMFTDTKGYKNKYESLDSRPANQNSKGNLILSKFRHKSSSSDDEKSVQSRITLRLNNLSKNSLKRPNLTKNPNVKYDASMRVKVKRWLKHKRAQDKSLDLPKYPANIATLDKRMLKIKQLLSSLS